MKKHLFIFSILIYSSFIILAQQTKQDTLEMKDFYMDFAISDITAFSILDVEPATISKPGNVKEFALGLTNYISKNGDLKSGLAVEWAPFKTFNKKTGNWENNSTRKTKFEWKNFALSLASASDSSNARLAGAFRFSPIDLTNPLNDKMWIDSISNYFYSVINQKIIRDKGFDLARRSFIKKISDFFLKKDVPIDLSEKLSAPIDAFSSYRLNSLKDKYDSTGVIYDRKVISEDVLNEMQALFTANNLVSKFEENKEEIRQLCLLFTDFFYQYHSQTTFQTEFNIHILKMKEEYKKKNWNKWCLQVSGGGLYNSRKATVEDLKREYYALAFSNSFPMIGKKWFKGTTFNSFMRKHSQLICLLKYQQYFTPDSTQNNSLMAGGRILMGNYNKRFSFEIAYIQQSNELKDLNQTGIRYSIGTEIKIMDNYWLELAVGGQNFEDKTGINILPTFAFRYSFGDENRYFKK